MNVSAAERYPLSRKSVVSSADPMLVNPSSAASGGKTLVGSASRSRSGQVAQRVVVLETVQRHITVRAPVLLVSRTAPATRRHQPITRADSSPGFSCQRHRAKVQPVDNRFHRCCVSADDKSPPS
jgi:hypothetical protein